MGQQWINGAFFIYRELRGNGEDQGGRRERVRSVLVGGCGGESQSARANVVGGLYEWGEGGAILINLLE